MPTNNKKITGFLPLRNTNKNEPKKTKSLNSFLIQSAFSPSNFSNLYSSEPTLNISNDMSDVEEDAQDFEMTGPHEEYKKAQMSDDESDAGTSMSEDEEDEDTDMSAGYDSNSSYAEYDALNDAETLDESLSGEFELKEDYSTMSSVGNTNSTDYDTLASPTDSRNQPPTFAELTAAFTKHIMYSSNRAAPDEGNNNEFNVPPSSP